MKSLVSPERSSVRSTRPSTQSSVLLLCWVLLFALACGQRNNRDHDFNRFGRFPPVSDGRFGRGGFDGGRFGGGRFGGGGEDFDVQEDEDMSSSSSMSEGQSGNLSCYSCSLDFRYGYDNMNPCLGLHGEPVHPDFLVRCGLRDLFCKVERVETNNVLSTLVRTCTDSCSYGCRPKGFGIYIETCGECCDTDGCNDFYPELDIGGPGGGEANRASPAAEESGAIGLILLLGYLVCKTA